MAPEAVVLTPAGGQAEWDDALAAAPGVTAFHRWGWLHASAGVFGWRFAPLLAVVSGDVVGAVPVLLSRRGPVPWPAPVPFPYVGPVVGPRHFAAVVAAQSAWALRHGAWATRLGLEQASPDQVAVLQRHRSLVHEETTFVVPLSTASDGLALEDLPGAVGQKVRRARRTAAAHGVDVRLAAVEDVWNVLPQVMDEAYTARGQVNPYTAAVVSRLWPQDQATGAGAALGAYDGEGRCLGILTVMSDGGPRAYGWVGGAFRHARSTQATALLYLGVMQWAARAGCTSLDMVGEVDAGVARFKREIGGRPQPFLTAIVPTGAPWALAATAARRVRAALRPDPGQRTDQR